MGPFFAACFASELKTQVYPNLSTTNRERERHDHQDAQVEVRRARRTYRDPRPPVRSCILGLRQSARPGPAPKRPGAALFRTFAPCTRPFSGSSPGPAAKQAPVPAAEPPGPLRAAISGSPAARLSAKLSAQPGPAPRLWRFAIRNSPAARLSGPRQRLRGQFLRFKSLSPGFTSRAPRSLAQ